MTRSLLLMAALTAVASPALAQAPLTTEAERSGFVRTGRYAEVIALCDAFARRYPEAVRCQDFGTTPEGRPMKVLVVSQAGAFTPAQARAQGLPVTLVQGGIHAGEIDGKDAGFLALREALDGQQARGALQRQVLLFVPVFNVDGHERFGAWNRPNQRGPEQTGWRTTAQNYNLNRDYVKADTPEMQAMLRLIDAWDPLVGVDLHATNGAQFEHDIAVMVEPANGHDPALRKSGLALREGTLSHLRRRGALPLPFYPAFDVDDDPASGFTDTVSAPRFSQSYLATRNRLGMLVETHSWRPYPHRVRQTRDTVVAVLELVARNGRDWRREVDAADARALAGEPVAMSWRTTAKSRTVAFRGYAYTRTPSEISGAAMTRYDESKPKVWNVPLRDEVVPDRVVAAPRAGYLVPAAHAGWVAARLDRHGIEHRRIDQPLPQAQVEAFRADKAAPTAQSVEGHQRNAIEGAWATETHDLAAGALFVPIAQRKARLAMAILEPQAPDSLAAWGEFNNAFERKEYMEAYVAEQVARDMLAADPALKARFEQRLREDEAFANSPQARLDFFYRLHTAWDERHNLYPVLRTDRAP